MGGIWSTMKDVDGSSKVSSVTTSPVCDGKTPTAPRVPCEKDNSVYEPVPSDKKVEKSSSHIKELFEPHAHLRSEPVSSSTISTIDSMTSEAKPLNSNVKASIRSSSYNCCVAVLKEIIVGASNDMNLVNAFRNCESVVQYKADHSNKNPCSPQVSETTEFVANVQTDGSGRSAQENYSKLKFIFNKAKEMVPDVVIKAFDGMERTFHRHEQPDDKAKESFDFMYASEERSNSEVFDAINRIMQMPYLAPVLISTAFVVHRIIRMSI